MNLLKGNFKKAEDEEMFLKKLIERNPNFIKSAIALHQSRKIPANSVVLDLDMINKNAAIIAAEGKRLGLKVFPMTKQIGRNPKAMDILAKNGLDAYVAVDMTGALPIKAAGYMIGHLGHLVQIPKAETDVAASLEPYYWTVFNYENAKSASDSSSKLSREQALLARIYAPGDTFYMGHEGGFRAEAIVKVADELDSLSHAFFAGITTFPALLFNIDSGEVEPTPNLRTLEKSANELSNVDRKNIEINAPGTTSSVVMEILASAGATQVEPGHGLTGTTPLHAVKDLPEFPAILYLTEISHVYNGHPYCFGGGLYIDPVFPDYDVKALIGTEPDDAIKNQLSVNLPPTSAIDYYGIVTDEGSEKVHVNDTVIFGFRPQAFVTRTYIVPVSGISKEEPIVKGVYTSGGRKTNWPQW